MLVSLLFKCIIWCLGWQLLDSTTLGRLADTNTPNTVAIFSHSSYWDFWIFMLYRIAYRQKLKDYKVLIKPEPFEYAGRLLRWCGAIPAGSIYKAKCGSTQVIIDELSRCDRWHLMLSPKGSILHMPWRSGWKVIAQHFKVPFRVVGLDYHQRRVVSSHLIDSNDIEASQDQILTAMTEATPLNPHNEIYETKYKPSTPIRLPTIKDLVKMGAVCCLYFYLRHTAIV